jgi:hypothetical protein
MFSFASSGHERITKATAALTSFGKAMLKQGSLYKLCSFNATHIYANGSTWYLQVRNVVKSISERHRVWRCAVTQRYAL